MEFKVKLTRNAKHEIDLAYLWLKQHNASYADKWFRDLMNTIATLQDKPKRCALARENDAFPQEIRQLIFVNREINTELFSLFWKIRFIFFTCDTARNHQLHLIFLT